jgi:hypothetical protein
LKWIDAQGELCLGKLGCGGVRKGSNGMEWVDRVFEFEIRKFAKVEVAVKVVKKSAEVAKSVGFSMDEDF